MLLSEAVNYLKQKKITVSQKYLWLLCTTNRLRHKRLYRYYTVDKKDIDVFAKKFDGVHIGRPKKGK